MWDDPLSSAEPGAQEPEAAVAWTDGQLMRLENEWRKAQRAFAYHPIIGITPLRGDPPYEFQIDFRVRSLAINEAGELQYVDQVPIHIWLPPGFPNQPPVARPMIGVFHPNISEEGVFLTQAWSTPDTLIEFAARIGELLAYRNYDEHTVVNPSAMEWLAQNSAALPLDAHADFTPFNGGEPLGRIQRLGPGTLDQIRRALDNMRFALLAEKDAPTMDEVIDFSRKTRAAVNLFLESDVPDHLRQQANECDDWCRELPDSVPLWEHLRHQRTRAAAAEIAADNLRRAAADFAIGLRDLDAVVRSDAPGSAAAAAKSIPSMERLQPLQLKLPPLGRAFEQWAAEASSLIEAMKEAKPEVPIAADGSMGRRLAAQGETVREAVESATRAAEKALAEVAPLLRRARPEIAALEQVVGWREYMDMFAKARALEKQLSAWGSDGVQAYYVTNDSGTFGPFQFEEPIDLGGARIVIRSVQRGILDVINAVGQEVLGRGTDGTAGVMLEKTESSAGYQTVFGLTERCEDVIVQLGFIQQHTIDALSQFKEPVAQAKSWCGAISMMISDPRQQQNLRDAHRKSAHRWKAVMTDLALLSKFKERLATYNLITRMNDEVPRLRGLISQAEKQLQSSTEVVSTIMGKSSRDLATDQLTIPPKHAKAYGEHLQLRDQAKNEIVRMKNLLKLLARELAARTGSTRLCGRPEIPPFRVLAPLSDALVQLSDAMSDEILASQIEELGVQLHAKLPFKPPPAPPASQVARPSIPTAAPTAEEQPIEEPPVATGLDEDLAVMPEEPANGSFEEQTPAGAEYAAPEANGGREETVEFAASVEPQAEEEIQFDLEPEGEEQMIDGFTTEEAPQAGHEGEKP